MTRAERVVSPAPRARAHPARAAPRPRAGPRPDAPPAAPRRTRASVRALRPLDYFTSGRVELTVNGRPLAGRGRGPHDPPRAGAARGPARRQGGLRHRRVRRLHRPAGRASRVRLPDPGRARARAQPPDRGRTRRPPGRLRDPDRARGAGGGAVRVLLPGHGPLRPGLPRQNREPTGEDARDALAGASARAPGPRARSRPCSTRRPERRAPDPGSPQDRLRPRRLRGRPRSRGDPPRGGGGGAAGGRSPRLRQRDRGALAARAWPRSSPPSTSPVSWGRSPATPARLSRGWPPRTARWPSAPPWPWRSCWRPRARTSTSRLRPRWRGPRCTRAIPMPPSRPATRSWKARGAGLSRPPPCSSPPPPGPGWTKTDGWCCAPRPRRRSPSAHAWPATWACPPPRSGWCARRWALRSARSREPRAASLCAALALRTGRAVSLVEEWGRGELAPPEAAHLVRLRAGFRAGRLAAVDALLVVNLGAQTDEPGASFAPPPSSCAARGSRSASMRARS